MSASPRRHLSYASLVLLLAADVLALAAIVIDQWFGLGPVIAWLLAAGATGAALPGLLWLADRVFIAAGRAADVQISGGTFP